MIDLIVLCEGQTEREFCNRVIRPYFVTKNIDFKATLQGKPGKKVGGMRSWPVYRKELVRLSKERDGRHIGLLVDYYGIPSDWPGKKSSKNLPVDLRGKHVEDLLIKDLEPELGMFFHPCIQLHEFETLLFSDPPIAAQIIASKDTNLDKSKLAEEMLKIRGEFDNHIERINDSSQTAPSKRIESLISGYDKVALGFLAAEEIGIKKLRDECPWLDRWMTKIELLK